jgi:hypothetical protein
MYNYNNKDKSKEEGINDWYELFSKDTNTHNTRELTPIWDMVSTLYKLQRQRDLRKGKITNPTKGTSKYHR